MNKIIFLDIDGVIAVPDPLKKGEWGLKSEKQELLGLILKESGAKIVLSSSWRSSSLKDTKEFMKNKGFIFVDEIIGVTIRAYHYIQKGIHLSIPRGVEIKQWLDVNIHSNNGKNWNRKFPHIDYSYVILDDDSDMLLEQKDYFIKTNSEEGLTKEKALLAIKILNKKV